ncbi:MAG: lysylphosphatidylglycerol synthase transmembrane domain-containing protein [Deltaproteobacteria bacterium]|nr:lysylphosphatidylglycerol synthase transmembrane domain-containing protein [Deltaproteobacteria bacterium]
MKNKLSLLGLCLSLVFLVLAFRNVPFASFFANLKHLNPFFVLIATIINLLVMGLKAYRWKKVLSPIEKVSFRDALKATFIGYMGNNIFPFRAGEIIRIFVMSRYTKSSKPVLLSTVATERIVEGLAFLGTFLILSYIAPVPDWVRNSVGSIAWVILGAFIALFLLTFYVKEDQKTLFRSRAIGQFFEGAKQMRSLSIFSTTLFLSCVSWVVQIAIVWYAARASGLSLGLTQSLFVMVVANIAVAIPSTAGHLGTYEYAIWIALSVFDISKADALGFAVTYHLLQWIPVTVIGWILMLRMRIGVKELQQEENGNGPEAAQKKVTASF